MVNDMTILYGIILFFVIIGAVTPFINAEFSSDIPEYSSTQLEDNIDTNKAKSSLSAFSVIGSILSMFFWTFGGIPLWLDAILFIPLRLIIVLIVARNIWIGGGA